MDLSPRLARWNATVAKIVSITSSRHSTTSRGSWPTAEPTKAPRNQPKTKTEIIRKPHYWCWSSTIAGRSDHLVAPSVPRDHR